MAAHPLFGQDGRVVGWCREDRVVSADGQHVGWVADQAVFDQHGRHRGHLVEGWLRDLGGHAVAFMGGSIGGPQRPPRLNPGPAPEAECSGQRPDLDARVRRVGATHRWSSSSLVEVFGAEPFPRLGR